MSGFLNKGKFVYAHPYNISKEFIVRLLYLQEKSKDTSFRVGALLLRNGVRYSKGTGF